MIEQRKKFLPIGTVVMLNKGNKKVMITTYFIFPNKGKDIKMYDYGACTFPEGIVENDYAIAFNHDDIAEILHMGLVDDEQKHLSKLLLDNEENIKKQFDELSKNAK